MKKFRSIKYRSLKKISPLGHLYRFVMDRDISAIASDGHFYQEDEDWMLQMTTHTGLNLLKWVNQPKELVGVIEVKNKEARKVVKLVDTPGFVRQDILPNLKAGKTQEQIEAEVINAQKIKRDEDIAAGIIIDEVLVTPLLTVDNFLDEPKVDSIEFFKLELAKSKNMNKFIKEMKFEFDVEELEKMCKDLGLEYEKPKANAIKMIVAKLGE